MNLRDILEEIEESTNLKPSFSKNADYIPVDLELVESITNKIVNSMTSQKFKKTIFGFLSNLFGPMTMFKDRFKVTNAQNESFLVNFKLKIKNFPIKSLVPTAFVYFDRKQREFFFEFFLNAKRWKYFSSRKNKFKKEIYAIVRHELTHIHDPIIRDPDYYGSGAVAQQHGFGAYVNLPEEVNAATSEFLTHLDWHWDEIYEKALEMPDRIPLKKRIYTQFKRTLDTEKQRWYSLWLPENKKKVIEVVLDHIDQKLENTLDKKAFVDQKQQRKILIHQLNVFSTTLFQLWGILDVVEGDIDDISSIIHLSSEKLKNFGYDLSRLDKISDKIENRIDTDIQKIRRELNDFSDMIDSYDFEIIEYKPFAKKNASLKKLLTSPIDTIGSHIYLFKMKKGIKKELENSLFYFPFIRRNGILPALKQIDNSNFVQTPLLTSVITHLKNIADLTKDIEKSLATLHKAVDSVKV